MLFRIVLFRMQKRENFLTSFNEYRNPDRYEMHIKCKRNHFANEPKRKQLREKHCKNTRTTHTYHAVCLCMFTCLNVNSLRSLFICAKKSDEITWPIRTRDAFQLTNAIKRKSAHIKHCMHSGALLQWLRCTKNENLNFYSFQACTTHTDSQNGLQLFS